jgi:hypothetical protein
MTMPSEEEILLKNLEIFEQNARWFSQNYSEIVEKYEGKTIAIKDQKIVAVKNSLDEVLNEFELKKRRCRFNLYSYYP